MQVLSLAMGSCFSFAVSNLVSRQQPGLFVDSRWTPLVNNSITSNSILTLKSLFDDKTWPVGTFVLSLFGNLIQIAIIYVCILGNFTVLVFHTVPKRHVNFMLILMILPLFSSPISILIPSSRKKSGEILLVCKKWCSRVLQHHLCQLKKVLLEKLEKY